MGTDIEWELRVHSEVEGGISNESSAYRLSDQVDNGITYQSRKHRLNCPSGRKLLVMCFGHREVPTGHPPGDNEWSLGPTCGGWSLAVE